MCGAIDGVLHPWIKGRELIHWMKRGSPIEFHRDHDTSLFEGNMNMTDFDTTYSLLDQHFRTWDPHPCHLSFIDNTLVPCVHWSHENLSVGMERLVELWPHFLKEYLGMYSLFDSSLHWRVAYID